MSLLLARLAVELPSSVSIVAAIRKGCCQCILAALQLILHAARDFDELERQELLYALSDLKSCDETEVARLFADPKVAGFLDRTPFEDITDHIRQS